MLLSISTFTFEMLLINKIIHINLFPESVGKRIIGWHDFLYNFLLCAAYD